MSQWFEQGLTTLAFLWRVERRDGVAVGFASHDRDLVRDEFLYRAAPGMVPSAIARSEGFDGDDFEVSGALTSDAFGEADLLSGRWDEAALTLSAVDWSDPHAEAVVLARGTLGAIGVRDGAFSASLSGASRAFELQAVEATSPTCRAELGDKRCRVDLAGRRQTAVVSASEGATVSFAGGTGGGCTGGRLRWLGGANAGLGGAIVADDGASVTLEDAAYFEVRAGDRAELTQGCDKRFATCRDRFGNAENFRGEPHLPGNDLLTRHGD